MGTIPAFNLWQWIEDHREQLKPPVANEEIYKDAENFIVMVSGGPNFRNDFHYNESEEFFFQLQGDITVRLKEDEGPAKDYVVKEGEIFLAPAKIPHSPQRPSGTTGLIIEKKRAADETDGFVWFCENCGNKLYEEYFHLTDIVKQLPPIMERFNSSEDLRTCSNCGQVMESTMKNYDAESHDYFS